MSKNAVTPIRTWITWSIIVLGAFLLLTWEYFVAGFSSDASKISHVLVLFFLYGFFSSLRTAIFLQKEFKSLNFMEQSRDCRTDSEIGRLFASAKELLGRGERVDIRNLVSSYGVKLGVRIKNVSVVSGMLITIGLLGTVIGLIITVGGLSDVLTAAGQDYDTMIAGMTETVSGMGTAFYTTFFGALLGGVVLRVLASEVDKSATQLAGDALELGELWLAPLCHEHAGDTLAQIEEQLQSLRDGLTGLGEGIGSVVGIIDSRQEALQQSLDQLVAETERSVAETLNGGIEQLANGFTAISQNMEAGMSKVITSTAQSMERGAENLAASMAAISQSMEQGTENLTSGFAAISENMEQGMTKVVTDAETSIAQAMEQGLGQLSSGLAALSQTMDEAQEPLHTSLACLAKEVEQAVAETRRQSDAQLRMRAGDIAQKLNVAASMLESLCPTESDAA